MATMKFEQTSGKDRNKPSLTSGAGKLCIDKLKPSFYAFIIQRQALAVLALVTAFSLIFRLIAFQNGTHHLYASDTTTFLHVVEFMHNILSTDKSGFIPQRIDYPLYSILIFFAESLMSDWLAAARIAALIPSILTPPLFCLIAWYLCRRLWAGCFAGLLGASSHSLISIGVASYSDSPYIFFSALAVLASLGYLRKPKYTRALVSGICAGLAWATRGSGLFYFFAISVPISLSLLPSMGMLLVRESNPSAIKVIKTILVFFTIFFLFGRGPTYILKSFTSGLKPPLSYNKTAYIDSALRAKGDRNANVYKLNEDCTELKFNWEIRHLSWVEIIQKYGNYHLHGAARNIRSTLTTVIPEMFRPFCLTFLLLALGLICVWRERPLLENFTLAMFAIPYITIIPAIILSPRYIYPLTVVVFPLMGWGLLHMMNSTNIIDELKKRITQAIAVAIFSIHIAYGANSAFNLYKNHDWMVPYRKAAQWITQQHGSEFKFKVMAANQLIYADLKRNTIALPVDALDRLARYWRYTDTRYILMGPKEIVHNLQLKNALAEKGQMEAGGMELKVVGVFGNEESGVVRLVEVTSMNVDHD
jgi:hypothetical protein